MLVAADTGAAGKLVVDTEVAGKLVADIEAADTVDIGVAGTGAAEAEPAAEAVEAVEAEPAAGEQLLQVRRKPGRSSGREQGARHTGGKN